MADAVESDNCAAPLVVDELILFGVCCGFVAKDELKAENIVGVAEDSVVGSGAGVAAAENVPLTGVRDAALTAARRRRSRSSRFFLCLALKADNSAGNVSLNCFSSS